MKYTTDHLDDAVLAGYSFAPVIDALNDGDEAQAGRELRQILTLYATDALSDDDFLLSLNATLK